MEGIGELGDVPAGDRLLRGDNAARNQPHWYHLKQKTLTETFRRQYDQEHSAMVAALLQRDADAARRLLHQHLARVRDRLLAIGA